MTVKYLYIVLLLLISSNTHGMKLLSSHKKKLTAFGIGTAAYYYDTIDDREIYNVSTPSKPQSVSSLLKQYKEKSITNSVTKDQLDNDIVLSLVTGINNPTLTKQQINRLSILHNWVIMPRIRKQLNHLARYVCHEENRYQRDYVSVVHGTTRGASMLLRTILDEVLNDNPKDKFVLLRNSATIKACARYANAQEYYTEKYNSAPRIPETLVVATGTPVRTGRQLVYLDLTQNRDELLCANLGLYGNNSWITSPRKESSLEFIAMPCSWLTQTVDTMLNVISLSMHQPSVMGKIVKEIVKKPSTIPYLPMLIDNTAKDITSNLMQEVFEDYGAADLYQKYKNELTDYEKNASAGLIQLMIPRKKAEQWCYVSEMLGVQGQDCSIVELQEQKKMLLPYYQARVVLHSDIIMYNPHKKNENTIMNFYLLTSNKELQEMTKRMYEIAYEIKRRQLE